MSMESVMPSNHLILFFPLLLLSSVFPSIRVFSNESALHIRWPQYWSFSISPSREYSGLIFFRIDWFDLRAVQGTFKILPQHHSWKASLLRHSAFFMVQLSHSYMTTRKTMLLLLLSRSVVSDSVQPHWQQPSRLLCPWDSPGKNTGVGCHFLLQCLKVKSESEIAQSCLILATPWTAAYQAT